MSKRAISITTVAVLLVVMGAVAWFFRPSPTPGPLVAASGCTRPAEIASVDDRNINLATAQFGKIAIGELSLDQNTEVVKLIGDSSQKLLVFDYLMCEARFRGDYNHDDAAQRERVQSLNGFLSTTPTADQFLQWMQMHQGQEPTARLVIPELVQEGENYVLELTDPVQRISLVNAGTAVLTAWVRNASPGRLLVAPRAASIVGPNDQVELQIGLLAPPESGPWRMQFGSSSSQTESQVEVRVAAAGKLAELMAAVAKEIQTNVESAPMPSAVGIGTDGPSVNATSTWVAERTHAALKRKYPMASDEISWAIAGAVLEQMNWNEPAVAAYRNSREKLGEAASELDVPLSRAQLLAGISSDPARQEKPVAQVLTAAQQRAVEITPQQQANQNALAVLKPEAATQLAETLAAKPALKHFATGLRRDVANASLQQKR